MAKVTLSGRSVVPTGSIGDVPLPGGFGQQKARALSRLGQTLESIGGDFATLERSVQAANDRRELSQAQIDYNSAMGQHLLDQEKNPNFNDWIADTTRQHDTIVSGIVGKKMTKRSKEDFGLWAQAQENSVHFKVATRSSKLIAEDERNGLQAQMESTALAGQAATFNQHLDEMVEANNLLPSERVDWQNKFERQTIINQVGNLLDIEEFDLAKEVIELIEDVELKRQMKTRLNGAVAAGKREKADSLRAAKEQMHATLLADYWDGALTNPQIVTDALREGLLTPEAAKGLNKALTDTTSRTTSDLVAVKEVEESLLKLRQGLIDKSDAYSTLMTRAGLLTNTDGKGYIKEISKTAEDVNSTWDRRAFDYIETQILNVSSLTGIKFGTGEQQALTAQAIIKYSEAKRAAEAKGKPLEGEELLALAHQIMIPFRQQIKPLLLSDIGEGELPGKLRVRPRPRRRRRVKITEAFLRDIHSQNILDLIVPETEADFVATFNAIINKDERKAFYEKHVGRFK